MHLEHFKICTLIVIYATNKGNRVNIPVNQTTEILITHVFNFLFSIGLTNSWGKLRLLSRRIIRTGKISKSATTYFNTMSRSKQMVRFSLQRREKSQGREMAAGWELASTSLVHIFPEALQSFVGQYTHKWKQRYQVRWERRPGYWASTSNPSVDKGVIQVETQQDLVARIKVTAGVIRVWRESFQEFGMT